MDQAKNLTQSAEEVQNSVKCKKNALLNIHGLVKTCSKLKEAFISTTMLVSVVSLSDRDFIQRV